MPDSVWRPVVFGGFVIAQAVMAAAQAIGDGRRIHSLHAYFLRPVRAGGIRYDLTRVREGRTLSAVRVDGSQEGKDVLTMTCSSGADADGYEYQAARTMDVREPDEGSLGRIGPWLVDLLGPTAPDADGARRSTHRMWFRSDGPLPEDAHTRAAFVAFASDITWTGGRPLHLDGDTRGMISVDHAIWFHRPLDPHRWTYYDVHSPINAAGRGLLHGAMYNESMQLCASVTQEMILQRYEDAEPR